MSEQRARLHLLEEEVVHFDEESKRLRVDASRLKQAQKQIEDELRDNSSESACERAVQRLREQVGVARRAWQHA